MHGHLQGNFFNDLFLLDLATWTWHRPLTLNTPPAPRYHHSAALLAGKVVVYGGINSKQTFDGVVVVSGGGGGGGKRGWGRRWQPTPAEQLGA